MPPHASSGGSDEQLPTGLVIAVAALIAAALYFVMLFFAGLSGLIEQLFNPAAEYDTNATIFLAMYPVFLALGHFFLPEFASHRRRLRIASRIALVPTALLPLTCGFLLPALASYAPWSHAAALFVVLCSLGVLPTLALARLVAAVSAEVRDRHVGDHAIDISKLSPETKRLVGKHTNGTMKPPPAWRPVTLFGSSAKLTHGDLQRILALEEDEERRQRDLYERRAANEEAKRRDAYHAFMAGLPERERALFEATLKADVEAIKGFAADKAQLTAEAARLTDENQKLLTAVKAGQQVEQALKSAHARVAAQNTELAVLKNTIKELRASATQSDALRRALTESELGRDALAHELEQLRDENARIKARHLPADPKPIGQESTASGRILWRRESSIHPTHSTHGDIR